MATRFFLTSLSQLRLFPINIWIKLKIALKNLGLDEYEKQINDLPDLRKNVAHGIIEYRPITFEQLNICKNIAKKVIIKYLEKNQIDNKML